MRKHLLIALVIAGTAGMGSGATLAETPAPADKVAGVTLDEAVAGIEKRYGDVDNFEAEFTQVVQLAHLPRPRKKTGKVYYQASPAPKDGEPAAPGAQSAQSAKMRWDYLAPERVYYVSDGTVLWSYEVDNKQVTKLPIQDSELYDSLKFLFGKGDLRASFDATLTGPDAKGLVGVRLVPKKGTQSFKSLTLWTKAGDWEIQRTELVNPVDGTSTITFSGISYAPLEAAGFDFTPPKGVAIQDLTKQAGGGRND